MAFLARPALCTGVVIGLVALQLRPACAQATSPQLTLEETVSLALREAPPPNASGTVRTAKALLSHSNPISRMELTTTSDVEPQPSGPPRYTLAEEYGIDLTSTTERYGELSAARADLATATASFSATRRAAATSALTAFFALAADEAQAAADAENVAFTERMIAASAERRFAGSANLSDAERMRFANATAAADNAATGAAQNGDRASLAVLIGSPDVAIALPAPAAGLPDATTAADAASRSNPTVVAAQAVVAAREADVLVAAAGLRSDFSVGAGVAVVSQGNQRSAHPAVTLGLGLPLSTPLTRGTVSAAQAAADAARADLVESRREAVQAVLRARTDALSALARVPPLERAYQSARSVAESDLEGYRRGRVSGPDLVASQLQYAAALVAVRAAGVQVLTAVAQLRLQMGEFDA